MNKLDVGGWTISPSNSGFKMTFFPVSHCRPFGTAIADERTQMRATKILLIEDSEDILFIMSAELESMGYHVDAALDGEHGLELAKANPPDLIVSDVQMPGIGGLEFVRRVREIPQLAAVPAVAVTGFSMEADLKRLLNDGFTAHLVKPVEVSELASLIQELTEPKKLTRAS